MILRTIPILATILALALPAAASGQSQYERPPDGDGPYTRSPEAEEAISKLKSPYCPGLMLEVCPSAGGAALRDSLETRADSGWTAGQLVEWVIANHGEEYRALPKAEGASLVAWIIPPAAVLLGVGVVVVVLGRMRKQKGGGLPPVRESVSAEEEERLRRALEELEEEEEAPFL